MLINAGRGGLQNEADILACLADGTLGAASLDVFETEPLPAESPFWDLPNVLVSPHSVSTVVGENEKIVEIFCWNLRCWLDGRRGEMRNVLDRERMY